MACLGQDKGALEESQGEVNERCNSFGGNKMAADVRLSTTRCQQDGQAQGEGPEKNNNNGKKNNTQHIKTDFTGTAHCPLSLPPSVADDSSISKVEDTPPKWVKQSLSSLSSKARLMSPRALSTPGSWEPVRLR